MKKLEEILFLAQKNFPQEFKAIIHCHKSDNHVWFIDPSAEQKDIRLVDVECENCKRNLAILLRFFSGIQDHG